jgi:hypothetical protein
MTKLRMFIVAMFALPFLIPLSAAAADGDDEGDLLFRTGGVTTVSADENLDVVIVINGDAVIDGIVTDTLVVIKGTATVNGRVESEIVIVLGTLNLQAGATVNDVTLIRSDLHRDPASALNGELSRRSRYVNANWWGWALFGFVLWLGATIAVLVLGLLFAAVAGRQLVSITSRLAEQPGWSVVSAILLWIVLPVAAVVTLFTIIGLPLGLMVLLALPLIWLLGYVVTGTLFGRIVFGQIASGALANHRYWPTVLGVLFFQLTALVPVLGGVVAGLAGFVGAGGLVLWLVSRRGTPVNGAALGSQ